jgi:hypothetical protein
MGYQVGDLGFQFPVWGILRYNVRRHLKIDRKTPTQGKMAREYFPVCRQSDIIVLIFGKAARLGGDAAPYPENPM